MANLSSASFTSVNDVETAQGAPVSEALAQRYGTNENNLDSRVTTNASSISTNAGNISTNASDITSLENALHKVEADNIGTVLNITSSYQTISTFTGTPIGVIVNANESNVRGSAVVVSGSTSTILEDAGTYYYEFRISGSNLQVKVSSGTKNASFAAIAFVAF